MKSEKRGGLSEAKNAELLKLDKVHTYHCTAFSLPGTDKGCVSRWIEALLPCQNNIRPREREKRDMMVFREKGIPVSASRSVT